MKSAPRHSSSGIALIIVMIAVTVLSILVAGFAYFMKVETRLAQNSNSEDELYRLGRSGVDYCRWILAQGCPNEPYDSLNQKWAKGPGGICSTNDDAAQIQETVYLGNGSFTWKITDLERKVNVNIAGPDALEQALRLVGVDAGEISTIAGSILDWIDTDEGTHLNGAESDYYQGLNPPYFAKNGPIDDLSELLLIKDVTPDIFWGGVASNHPPASFQAKYKNVGRGGSTSGELIYPVGLNDLLTPLSSGKININTASAIQLQMIPGVDEDCAAAIITFRAGPDGADGTDDDTPFRNVGELINVPCVNPQMIPTLQGLCDVHSHVFEVHITANVAGYTREFFAILGRNSAKDIKTLSFYWK